MTILHIDSSITGEHSVSRQLSATALAKISASRPEKKVVYRDLAATPLEHYRITDKPGQETQESVLSGAILDEFLDADTVIIGAPLYNFTISSQLKAWVDRLVIAGITFNLDNQGNSVGLVGDKRVIILLSRGSVYQPGAPWAQFEHAETYLKAIFGFIGIQPTVIVAEGTAFGPESRAKAISAAESVIAAIS
ncbi:MULTISPECIES: FMN-dependent NADH-azoreductase [Enterobacteriaceae]|uniref:FMN-dependent NADH-azoreductase n=1 Tax=Enterobacteriaceae TaxID=543 RepID=UPI00086315F1|nr:NAD(P)H-dependent oxidoreductase [Klebsiella sp. LTGPAF-6F]AOV10027.1 hypothetical protein BJF97_02860 [Klebsiella sp. LTGPAF-6F]